MNFHKKIILVLQMILVLNWCSVLTGCTGGSISLEEALEVSKSDTAQTSAFSKDAGSAAAGSAGHTAAETGLDSLVSVSESGEQTVCQTENLFYVYVCGSVAQPGVYALKEDSRIVAAIEAAGGFLEDAATEAVNLAAPISDGMQIVVPDRNEAAAAQMRSERQANGQVNLNTATAAELCTLSGIGEAKAEAILAYREEIGAFTSIEQIKNVTGIGESLFKQIKESIYIE